MVGSSHPGGCSAILGVVRAGSHGGGLLVFAPSHCFGPASAEEQIRAAPVKDAGSGLLFQWWLPYTYSCGGHCLGPAPAEVAGSVLFPRMSLGLGLLPSCGGP